MGYSGESARRASKGLPWHALLALGRRSGYLLPYDDRGRGGKEHKRYGANAEFAEVLVAATVVPGDPSTSTTSSRSCAGTPLASSSGAGSTSRSSGAMTSVLVPRLQRSVSVNENDLRANLTCVPGTHRSTSASPSPMPTVGPS